MERWREARLGDWVFSGGSEAELDVNLGRFAGRSCLSSMTALLEKEKVPVLGEIR